MDLRTTEPHDAGADIVTSAKAAEHRKWMAKFGKAVKVANDHGVEVKI